MRSFTRFLLWLDIDDLTGAPVVADQTAVLPLRVHDVGIDRVNHGLITIAADGDEEVLVGDTRTVERARRAGGEADGGFVETVGLVPIL